MKIKNKSAIERVRKAKDHQQRGKDAIAERMEKCNEKNRKKSDIRWALRRKIGHDKGVSSVRVILMKPIDVCNNAKELVQGEHYSINKQRSQK